MPKNVFRSVSTVDLKVKLSEGNLHVVIDIMEVLDYYVK